MALRDEGPQMKAHIGVDAETGIVHSLRATAANVHDVTEAHNLLHGGEAVVWGDSGHRGVPGGGQAQGERGISGGMAGGDAAWAAAEAGAGE